MKSLLLVTGNLVLDLPKGDSVFNQDTIAPSNLFPCAPLFTSAQFALSIFASASVSLASLHVNVSGTHDHKLRDL